MMEMVLMIKRLSNFYEYRNEEGIIWSLKL